jgi:hypothetical protein
MRNDAPIVLAVWAARVNAETRAFMGVVVGPELPEYSPPPDKFHRGRREARVYLDRLMSAEEAAACAAADVERVRAIRERGECPCEDDDGWDREAWAQAAREYHEARDSKPFKVAIAPTISPACVRSLRITSRSIAPMRSSTRTRAQRCQQSKP